MCSQGKRWRCDEQAAQYDVVKNAVLPAYELVPEAYHQWFRNAKRPDKQTFVEFSREEQRLFNRWCISQKAESREELRQLVLLEDFMNCVPETVALFLSEQEVKNIGDAAVLADKFVLTHKRVPHRSPQCRRGVPYRENQLEDCNKSTPTSPSRTFKHPLFSKTEVICFHCKKPGHEVPECLQRKSGKNTKSFALVASCGTDMSLNTFADTRPVVAPEVGKSKFDTDYAPFVTDGFVSLPDESCGVPVRILRDTGAAQSFLLSGVLPLSASTDTRTHVLIKGFEMTPLQVPLHRVCLSSELVHGDVVVGVCPSLPIQGISFVLGNDLAGSKVWSNANTVSPPVVASLPELPPKPDKWSMRHPDVFPACAVTRATANYGVDPDVSLEDTFLVSPEVDSSVLKLPVGELESSTTNTDDATGDERVDRGWSSHSCGSPWY